MVNKFKLKSNFHALKSLSRATPMSIALRLPNKQVNIVVQYFEGNTLKALTYTKRMKSSRFRIR